VIGQASYLRLVDKGELSKRVESARRILQDCELCPRRCHVNRLKGELGQCQTGERVVVSSFGPHFGEEAPLVGTSGSGTIFFGYCNLHCVFCQNYSISQLGDGSEASTQELAYMMVSLQRKGCHNINLVTPTHVVPQILEALGPAIDDGLKIPLVYNCGGYESLDTLRLLDGIVDIYMPDMKYSDNVVACQYSGVEDYAAANQAAVKEMHRQVGDLQIDPNDIAIRGLLVRHLVLPHGLGGTRKIVEFLAGEVSSNTFLNIMAQYHPCHKAHDFPLLNRPITTEEYLEAIKLAVEHGVKRLDQLHYPGTARVMF
jgi:putative pyruvate formate lyase activating enzyme